MAANARKRQPVAAPTPDRRTLEMTGERLRIVAVADTHSHPHPQTHALIAGHRPDYIVHAGDIGDLSVLDRLAELAPVLAIRGNIDAPARDLPEALTVEVRRSERLLLRFLLLHIAVYGPKLRADAARLARSEGANLVICGHSHVPFIGRDAGLGIFNPGSVGPRRFQLPIVFGVLEIDSERARMHHVSCETGAVWQPG